MNAMPASPPRIEQIYRDHSRRVLAALIRLLNDFNLAEECLQEAFIAALRQWPQDGIPDNPAAWLISAGHRRGIDQIRRIQTARRHAHLVEPDDPFPMEAGQTPIDDDLLRLLFTCCHPALAARLAYQRALALVVQEPERRFLARQLRAMEEQLASRIPPARLGSIEVRPVRELPPKD